MGGGGITLKQVPQKKNVVLGVLEFPRDSAEDLFTRSSHLCFSLISSASGEPNHPSNGEQSVDPLKLWVS